MRSRLLLSLAIVLVLAVPPSGAARGEPRPFAWQQLGSAPTAGTEVAAALDGDGHIVVAGGFNDSSETVATVEIYEPKRNRWTKGPSLPIAVDHVTAASLRGDVYVFGGYAADGSPSDKAFVLRGGDWHSIPPMPEPRAAAGAATAGGKLYVAGGIGPNGLASSTLVFDPDGSGSWSTAPGLREPREHLGVATSDGRVYVLGGRSGGDLSATVEMFMPKKDHWRRLPDMPTARGGNAAGTTSNRFIVVAGGEGNDTEDGTFPEVEAFDVDAARWVSLPPMPTPRHGLGVVGIGNTIYTLAGGPQAGFAFSGAVEAINLNGLRSMRCFGERPTLVGSPGREALTGTGSRDVITSLGGPDLVRGGAGRDLLCGGPGNDTLIGGPDRDRLDGDSGDDRCVESGPRSRRLSCEG